MMKPYFITCFMILVANLVTLFVTQKATIINITTVIKDEIIRAFFASGAIKNFGSIQMTTRIGALWFLPALFFAIIIVQFIINYSKKNEYRWIAIGLISLMGFISSKFIWLPFSIQSGMFATLFVFLGYQFKEKNVLTRIKWKEICICLVIFCVGIYKGYAETYFVTNSFNDIIINMCVGVAASIIVIKLSTVINSKILAWFGRNSLTILCIHLFELEALYIYKSKLINCLYVFKKYGNWLQFMVSFMIIICLTMSIILIKKYIVGIYELMMSKLKNLNGNKKKNNRDGAIDILRGVGIILMLIGHSTINQTFRRIIYFFHMPLFIVLSGYLYRNKNTSLFRTIYNLTKHFMVPYVIFCIIDSLLNIQYIMDNGFSGLALKYVLGMSFSKTLFINIKSVGPVYFILVLYSVRIIYEIIERFIKSDGYKIFVCFVLSLTGLWLGKKGYWLPWSFDCTLYLMVFYVIGIYIKKYNLFNLIYENAYCYFAISCVGAYAIYSSSMELAIRNYGKYGIVIFGVISLIFLMYMLCRYVSESKLYIIKNSLMHIGRYTLYVLMFHTLFGNKISKALQTWFSSTYGYHLIFLVAIQILLGVVIGKVIDIFKKKMVIFLNKNKDIQSFRNA